MMALEEWVALFGVAAVQLYILSTYCQSTSILTVVSRARRFSAGLHGLQI